MLITLLSALIFIISFLQPKVAILLLASSGGSLDNLFEMFFIF